MFTRPPTTDRPARTLLAEYGAYADAQAAVDRLSDSGFPVQSVAIVWDGLRQVEEVTGRRTTLNAVADGALAGAWFGGFLGLLLSLFVEVDDGVNVIALVLTYLVAGAVLVGIWRGVSHWLQRGTRDFGTIGRIEAARYQIWVDAAREAEAATVLGVRSTRSIDPQPEG